MVHIVGETKSPPAENEWQEKVTECAQQFSQAMEERFVGSKMRAESFLPKKPTDDVKAEATGIFLDYLLGTTVAIVCDGRPAPPEFEEDVVAIIRDKFVRLRSIHKRPN